MWEMIAKMTVATLLYVLITAGLWLFCRKKAPGGTGIRVLIGLIYGACSVFANHIGIDNGIMTLNVRDIGPLAAGLFFSPLSGILAGVIGGAERYLAGTLWDIGSFTTVACSVSTCLAGFLGAFLNRVIYKGRRPSSLYSFFLGALMEVFHMYSLLLIRQDELSLAYYVVRSASIPMIVFTGLGLAGCSFTIRKLSREQSDFGWGVPDEKIPVGTLFQRWLLAVTVVLFCFNFAMTWQFRTRLSRENAVTEMMISWYSVSAAYEETGDTEVLEKHLEDQFYNDNLFMLLDDQQAQLIMYGVRMEEVDPADTALMMEHTEESTFTAPLTTAEGMEVLCYIKPLDDRHSLMIMRPLVSVYEDRNNELYENTLSDILLFTVLYVLILLLVEHLVVKNLDRVNASLKRITGGRLEEKVWVRTSAEFSELSDEINQTVTALKGYIDEAGRKMEEDLKLAAAIQDAALPRNFQLPSERIELYATMTPAKQVGGDFYDFFFIDIGRLCMVIADVSGKGVPASLFMMRAKTSIKYYARSGMGPAELLSKVNNALCEDNATDMFVTVWLGILDLKTGLMRCCNAGHEYPVLMRADGEYELFKRKHGMMLAAYEGIPLTEYEIQLNPGDRMFVYTDGVPEAINEKTEAYGTERMTQTLNRLRMMNQKETLEGMLRDIRNFAGNADQFDDITMLGFTYLK